MLSRLSAAKLLLPTVMTLVSLAVLVSLGSWQISRKAWKDALIAQIAARVKAEPVGLDAVLGLYTASQADTQLSGIEYTRLRVTGRFRHDRELFLYAPHPKLGPGYHVLTPLEVTGSPRRVLLVNRGYVTEALKDRAKRPEGVPTGETSVTGLVRLTGEKGGFTPANEPSNNLWYWRDIPALLRAAVPGAEHTALPFMLDAEAPANPGGWPKGGATEIKLPNRHLEYALTWFGLAGALIAVYGIYALGRLRVARGG